MKTPLRVDAEGMAYPRQIIDKGKQIIAAGAATDRAYFLISGRARAQNPLVSEGELQSGDFLSFVSFLALDAYDADVIATTQAEVLICRAGWWNNAGKTKIKPVGFLPVRLRLMR